MTLASVYLTLLPILKTSKTSGLPASKEVNRYLGSCAIIYFFILCIQNQNLKQWCSNIIHILNFLNMFEYIPGYHNWRKNLILGTVPLSIHNFYPSSKAKQHILYNLDIQLQVFLSFTNIKIDFYKLTFSLLLTMKSLMFHIFQNTYFLDGKKKKFKCP